MLASVHFAPVTVETSSLLSTFAILNAPLPERYSAKIRFTITLSMPLLLLIFEIFFYILKWIIKCTRWLFGIAKES